MKLTALIAALAGLAWGQLNPRIEPEAERLYRQSTTALEQLSAYEMDVETRVSRPAGQPGDPFLLIASVAARQPDRILISGSTPFEGKMTVYSDGHRSLFWRESANQFATIDAVIPDAAALHLTNLTPGAEPMPQTLIAARVLREEAIDLGGDIFHCKVIEVSTTARDGMKTDPKPHTLWIDKKTGVALRQETGIVPPRFTSEIPARITVTRFRYGAAVNDAPFSFIVPADATEVDWHQLDLAVTNRSVVGRTAPPLHLTTLDGRPFDAGKFKGKPTLLHFQTTWCKPCDDGVPGLENVAKAMGSEARIVLVNAGESPDAVRAAIPNSEWGGRFPLMAQTADLESLGLKAWPANLLIGRDGQILSFETGEATEAALLALLRNAAGPAPAQPPVWGVAEPGRRHGRPAENTDDTTPPELVYKVDPGYTQAAQRAKISGTVMLAILVGKDGKVTDIHVLEKLDPGLDARAISAVSRWLFKPATENGVPVAFRARAGVSFSAVDSR